MYRSLHVIIKGCPRRECRKIADFISYGEMLPSSVYTLLQKEVIVFKEETIYVVAAVENTFLCIFHGSVSGLMRLTFNILKSTFFNYPGRLPIPVKMSYQNKV